MEKINIAIIGGGVVGGAAARIILDKNESLNQHIGLNIAVKTIIDLQPQAAAARYQLPLDLFCSSKAEISPEEADQFLTAVLQDDEIDLVVETIGGDSAFVLQLVSRVLKSKKHLVTANKALLARYQREIFELARQNNKAVGFEGAVCGAIPIIKGMNECFLGDEVLAFSGILNGTSNFILTQMSGENINFNAALQLAQDQGYAEADPFLDISGGDAAHKLIILLKLIYGIEIKMEDLSIIGIEQITRDDIGFAEELNCVLKLIGYARREGDRIYATIQPMMVSRQNILSDIHHNTNAVKMVHRYSQENVLIGKGAGGLETGSAVVSDIIFIAQHKDKAYRNFKANDFQFKSFNQLKFTYQIIFETDDIPGITGIVTTEIGRQGININTVSHNRHNRETALFSVVTMPCTYLQIEKAINCISPDILRAKPRVIPVLYD